MGKFIRLADFIKQNRDQRTQEGFIEKVLNKMNIAT